MTDTDTKYESNTPDGVRSFDRTRLGVFAPSIALLLLTGGTASLLVWVRLRFPDDTKVYPTFVLGVGTFILLVLLANSIRTMSGNASIQSVGGYFTKIRIRSLLGVALFMALWIVYVASLSRLGFVAPTSLVLVLGTSLLTSGWKSRAIATAVIIPSVIVLYLLMYAGLNVGLPSGPLDQIVLDVYYRGMP